MFALYNLTMSVHISSDDCCAPQVNVLTMSIYLTSNDCCAPQVNVLTMSMYLTSDDCCAPQVNVLTMSMYLTSNDCCAPQVNVLTMSMYLTSNDCCAPSDDCVLTMSVHIALFHWCVCHRNTVLYYVNIHRFGWLMYLLHKDPVTVSEIWMSYLWGVYRNIPWLCFYVNVPCFFFSLSPSPPPPPSLSRNYHLSLPRPRINIFKTSISFSGAHLWNSLPLTVRFLSVTQLLQA